MEVPKLHGGMLEDDLVFLRPLDRIWRRPQGALVERTAKPGQRLHPRLEKQLPLSPGCRQEEGQPQDEEGAWRLA